MRRIHVVGATGSGKTTLAKEIARTLNIPHIELDSLHWEPGWVEAPKEVFRERVSSSLEGDAWVVDGNYSKARDIVWARADSVVWLDYSLGVILFRLFKRTLRRIFTREELWNGNRETLLDQFLSRNSLFLWALKTYQRRRKEYPQLFSQPQYGHLTVIHLPSLAATQSWLEKLAEFGPHEEAKD